MFGSESRPRSEKPKFVPFATMFKLDDYSPSELVKSHIPRNLRCINCGRILSWRLYTTAPTELDKECPSCHNTADSFWDGKVHRKVGVDA